MARQKEENTDWGELRVGFGFGGLVGHLCLRVGVGVGAGAGVGVGVGIRGLVGHLCLQRLL